MKNRTVSIGLLSAGLGFAFSQVLVVRFGGTYSPVVGAAAILLVLCGMLSADFRGPRDPVR